MGSRSQRPGRKVARGSRLGSKTCSPSALIAKLLVVPTALLLPISAIVSVRAVLFRIQITALLSPS